MNRLEENLLKVKQNQLFWKMAKAYWDDDRPLVDKTKREYIKISTDLREGYRK